MRKIGSAMSSATSKTGRMVQRAQLSVKEREDAIAAMEQEKSTALERTRRRRGQCSTESEPA